jgi:hypothetical protein
VLPDLWIRSEPAKSTIVNVEREQYAVLSPLLSPLLSRLWLPLGSPLWLFHFSTVNDKIVWLRLLLLFWCVVLGFRWRIVSLIVLNASSSDRTRKDDNPSTDTPGFVSECSPVVHRRIFNRRVQVVVVEEDGLGGGAVFFRRRVVVVFVFRWLRPAYPSTAVDRGVRPVVVVVAVVAAVVV